ncbi:MULTISPECIES: histidine kinase [unclassified Pseudomonas]|uniref:histidine kinase n=1 Tax=unclassified Pseudomonas TaxID=196821 RepID=UPI0015A24FD3|nr:MULTISPECIES: histidine kinase [unclassified Pseudomonas]NWC93100.1 histidine kinase [Pseudomonas sp. IPO3779]NWD19518.1 histidine kinase [Pseudomonas sp. IPO3778]
MVNPKLRILLVDEEHTRLVGMEKNLSRLGYNRVAPLTSLRELLVILDNALTPFDLLIIHEAVLNNAGEVLGESVRRSPAIKHLLFYRADTIKILCTVESSPLSMRFALPCPPDREAIRQLMDVVERTELHEIYGKKCVYPEKHAMREHDS